MGVSPNEKPKIGVLFLGCSSWNSLLNRSTQSSSKPDFSRSMLNLRWVYIYIYYIFIYLFIYVWTKLVLSEKLVLFLMLHLGYMSFLSAYVGFYGPQWNLGVSGKLGPMAQVIHGLNPSVVWRRKNIMSVCLKIGDTQYAYTRGYYMSIISNGDTYIGWYSRLYIHVHREN